MTLTLHELAPYHPAARGLGGLGAGDWEPITEANISQRVYAAGRQQGIQLTTGGRGCAMLANAMANASLLMLQASQRDFDAQQNRNLYGPAKRRAAEEKTIAFNHWNRLRGDMVVCERKAGQRAVVIYRAGSPGDKSGRRVYYVVGGQYVGDAHQRGVLADPRGYRIDLAGNPVRTSTVVAGPDADAPAPVSAPQVVNPTHMSPIDVAVDAMERGSPYKVGAWQRSFLSWAMPESAQQPTVRVRATPLTIPQVSERAAVLARDAAREEAQTGGQFYSGWMDRLFSWTDTSTKFAGGTPPSEERAGFTQPELVARREQRASRDPAVAARTRQVEADRIRFQAEAAAATRRAEQARTERERAAALAQAEAAGRSAALAKIQAEQDRIRARAAQARAQPAGAVPAALPMAPPALHIQSQVGTGPPSWLLPLVMVGSIGLLTWVGWSFVSGR